MLTSRLRLFLAGASLLVALSAAFAACGSDCSEVSTCFRAVSCVSACGEDPVQVGCCPCPEGTFDDAECVMKDAGDGG